MNVTINRPDFMFNPTNCSPLAITGESRQQRRVELGVVGAVPGHQLRGVGVQTELDGRDGGEDRRNWMGRACTVKSGVSGGPYDANIARVKVELPKALPSRLPTLQKACLASVFEADPANCPSASIIGHASATTPVLPVALTGPAYFVSHGGEAFPSLIIVLQGYGATVDLVGSTFISKQGITSSTFKTIPDVPVGTFELTLPQGPYSALTANGKSLCASKLVMPTEFVGQNGVVLHQSAKIVPTGCGKTRKAAHKTKKAAHKKKRKQGRKAEGERRRKG